MAVLDLFKSRKAILALALIAGATVLAALERMDVAAWTDFAKWIFGLYVAGNVGEHAATAIRDRGAGAGDEA